MGVFPGPSAGEGRLPGGGVGELPEGQTRLPLHRSAPLCQDEEDRRGVSPQWLFSSHPGYKYTGAHTAARPRRCSCQHTHTCVFPGIKPSWRRFCSHMCRTAPPLRQHVSTVSLIRAHFGWHLLFGSLVAAQGTHSVQSHTHTYSKGSNKALFFILIKKKRKPREKNQSSPDCLCSGTINKYDTNSITIQSRGLENTERSLDEEDEASDKLLTKKKTLLYR